MIQSSNIRVMSSALLKVAKILRRDFSELEKIPQTESLKDTYNRVVPFYHSNIESDLIHNKNILISAHGNSIRALGKKIFNISDEKINLLEIPTGNPLLIIFDNSGKFKYTK